MGLLKRYEKLDDRQHLAAISIDQANPLGGADRENIGTKAGFYVEVALDDGHWRSLSLTIPS
jgi:hypothetical protein